MMRHIKLENCEGSSRKFDVGVQGHRLPSREIPYDINDLSERPPLESITVSNVSLVCALAIAKLPSRTYPVSAAFSRLPSSVIRIMLLVVLFDVAGCSREEQAPTPKPESTRLIKVGDHESTAAQVDIVFVHGLGGDGHFTWQADDSQDTFWPNWLAEDFPDARVWSIDYEAHVSDWIGNTLSLQDRAVGLLQELRLEAIGEERPVLFIVHSMGGLLVKQMLRKASEESQFRKLAENTKGVLFLATPHTGSPGATIIKVVDKVLPTLVRANITNEQLRSNDPYLRDLNQWYRGNIDHDQVLTYVLAETKETSGLMIVPENSVDPGITDVLVVPIPEHSHIDISKPSSRDSLIYRLSKDFVKEAAPPPSDISLAKYIAREQADRWKLKNHSVEWAGIVKEVSLRPDRNAYLLMASEEDRDVSENHVRAVMRPGEFVQVPVGTRVRVRGVVTNASGPLGTILEKCILLDEKVEAAD